MKETNIDIITKLEQLVKHYREAKTLATELNISTTTLSYWRTGKRPVSKNRITDIESLYDRIKNKTILPKEMTEAPQWVMWKRIHGAKVPHQKNRHKASSTNPKNWCKYDELITVGDDYFNGIGFVITKGWIFIDLDHVLNYDKTFKAEGKWAEDLIKELKPQYIEVSPSGDGLHCFFKGELPHEHRNKVDMKNKTSLEVYTKDRFSTITAQPFNNSPLIPVELDKSGIETLMSILGVKDEVDVDTDSKTAIELPEDKIKELLTDIEPINSDDMSKVDLAFFKDYISERRTVEPNSIPTVQEMQKALRHKGMYELRRDKSRMNPDKYKRKDYISSTIQEAIKRIQLDFEEFVEVSVNDKKIIPDQYDEIFLDIKTGKYVFIKDKMLIEHEKAKAILLLPPKIGHKYLINAPKYYSEYNPTKPKFYTNRFGMNTRNTFIPSEYVLNSKNKPVKIPENISTLLNHLITDKELLDTFLNALANHLQNGTSIHLGWIFTGTEGAGKGLLMSVIEQVFGVHNFTKTKLNSFKGDKVKGVVDKLIAFADESANATDMEQIVENLKSIIANETYSSRALYTNEIDVLNFTMYFFAANSFGFKLSIEDRRMNIIDCNKKLSTVVSDTYKFKQDLLNEVQDFTDYLLNYKVNEKALTKVIKTNFRQRMISQNLSIEERISQCIINADIEPLSSGIDEEHDNYDNVINKLNIIGKYERVQGTVISELSKELYELTGINTEDFKKNSITSRLKKEFEYKVFKVDGKPVKGYVFIRKDTENKVLTHQLYKEECNITDLADFN